LDHLYGRVSPGGWVVIDDYGILPPCRQAVDSFRKRESVNETMSAIDDHAVAWRVGIE
jgi:O-methyltransferase